MLNFYLSSITIDGFKYEPTSKTDKNIWVISKDEINISQKVYKIEKESFSRFLDDIQNFTELKNMNKLNIFKSKI